MLRFIIRRLLQGILTLWLVSTTVFVMGYLIPNDPARAIAGEKASLAQVERVHKALGLDRPLIVQYGDYMGRLVKLDLGKSYLNGGTGVFTLIKSSLPTTVYLVFGAGILWLSFGILSGVLSAVRARTWVDKAVTSFVLIGLSVPPAVFALLLSYVMFYQLWTHGVHLFVIGPAPTPSTDFTGFLQHMALPWVALAFFLVATYTRLTRGSLLEVFGEDYMRTAKSKGLSDRRIIYRHGLRAALTPVITQFGVDIGALIGGTLVTESVFGLNGFGRMAINALQTGDVPTVIGAALFVAMFVVVANLIVDVLYAFLDPRIRLA